MISTLKEVREALEILHNGLSWFKDSYPQDVNGSDDEAETEFQTAFTKLDALIAATEKAEPVAWQYQSRDGSWNSFLNDKHYDDTKADGSWPIRALYTAPQSAPSTSPLTLGQIHDALLSICDDGSAPASINDLEFVELIVPLARAIEAKIGAKP